VANITCNEVGKRAPSLLIGCLFLSHLFLLPQPGWSGEYHSYRNGTLYCDECHLSLVSPKDLPSTVPSAAGKPAGWAGNPYLLRYDGNEVCLSCHDDNPGAVDVVGFNRGEKPGIVREAGALNMVSGGYPYSEENGHTLGLETPAPGSDPQWIPSGGLKCIDCHDPHGENPNGNSYRNLVATPGNTPYPGILVTYSSGTNDPGSDVFVRCMGGYDVSDVDFNEPSPGTSAMAAFCGGCHTDFHGSKGGPEVGGASGVGWIRHPSSDADIGHLGGRHSRREVFAGEWSRKEDFVKVMTGTGNWRPQSASEVVDHTPTCLTCHKAHGNRNPFGLIFMGNNGPVNEEGTPGGSYTDLCRQCHVQSLRRDHNRQAGRFAGRRPGS